MILIGNHTKLESLEQVIEEVVVEDPQKKAGRDTTGMCAPTEEEWRTDDGLYNLREKQNYLSQNLGKWLNDRSVGKILNKSSI